MMDTWLLVRILESANERNRLLYVLKSRGMAHSNQVREEQLKVNSQLEALQLRIASLKEDMKVLTEEDDARRKLAAEEQLNLSRARQAD